jgi:hypothetical protein
MSEYKYTVASDDGYTWGLFKTKSQAGIMRKALINEFGLTTKFWVEEV